MPPSRKSGARIDSMSELIQRCKKLAKKGYLSVQAHFDSFDIEDARDQFSWCVYHEDPGRVEGPTLQVAWDRFRALVEEGRVKNKPADEAAKVDVGSKT